MTEPQDDVDDFPEQYSDATRTALTAAVEALLEGLRTHASYVAGLRGGSSEIPALHAANAQVERLLDDWNERVFDHTGTWPVSLEGLDEDDAVEGEEFDEPDDLVEGAHVSVISRWDLTVVDKAALLRAARQAHQRLLPEENDEDAEVAVPDIVQALCALKREAGEPWLGLPGIEFLRGDRAYIEPDGPVPPPVDDDPYAPVVAPTGRQLLKESWV